MSNLTKTNSEQRSEEWLQIRKIIRDIDYRGGNIGASDEAVDKILELIAQQQSELLEMVKKEIIDYFAGAGEFWFDYIRLTDEEQRQVAEDNLEDLLQSLDSLIDKK